MPRMYIQDETAHEFGSLDYGYPDGLDLVPGSDLHENIVHFVEEKVRVGRDMITYKESTWDSIEDTLSMYIKLSDEEEILKSNNPNTPVSIVVPYSYAILNTIMSYLVEVFLNDPMWRYEGTGSVQDEIGAIKMERVIAHNVYSNKIDLAAYIFLRDCIVYGRGGVSPAWEEKWGTKVDREGNVWDEMSYEGNVLRNIDPRKLILDPNRSVHDVDKAGFAGWETKDSFVNLLEMEQNDPTIFNVRYLRGRRPSRGAELPETGSTTQYRYTDTRLQNVEPDLNISWIYAKFIPSNLKLNDDDYPQKWLLGVCNGIVIKTHKVLLNHNMTPVKVGAPDFDGWGAIPLSRMETLEGLQTFMNFKINTNITETRKKLNDVIVYDPYLINEDDLLDPEPGKAIRMKMAGWGMGKVKESFIQLDSRDATAENINHAYMIGDIMQRVSAAADYMQGVPRQSTGERVSATEFAGTQGGNISRLAMAAKIIGMQCFRDIGIMFAHHTQQFMEKELWVKMTQEHEEKLGVEYGSGQRIQVAPNDLQIPFDVQVNDGSVAGSEHLSSWTSLWQMLLSSPETQQRIDVTKVFMHMARLMKAKNVHEFIRKGPPVQAEVVPDETAMRQVEQGNLSKIS